MIIKRALAAGALALASVEAGRNGFRKGTWKLNSMKAKPERVAKPVDPKYDMAAAADAKIPARPASLGDKSMDRTAFVDPAPFTQVYGNAGAGNCGETVGNRVTGGVGAVIEDNPWAVFFLGCQDLSLPTRKCFRCAGSIISPRWVLTAASCTHSVTAEDSAIIYGLADIKDKWAGYFSGSQGQPDPNYVSAANWKDVGKIIKHENYDARTHDYDIAVAATFFDFTMSDQTFPICLPAYDFCLNAGTDVEVMGWGDKTPRTHHQGKLDDYSTTMQITELPIVNYTICKRYHQSNKHSRAEKLKIRQRNICAGDGSTVRQHICEGDRGGPMVYKDANGISQLVGTASFGFGCENFGKMAIYSRTTSYLKWITDNTGVINDGGVGDGINAACVDEYENIGAGTAFAAANDTASLEDENKQIHGHTFLQNFCAYTKDFNDGRVVKFVGIGKCADISKENTKWELTPTSWIKNVANNKCWTCEGCSDNTNTFPTYITIQPCNATDEDQHFSFDTDHGFIHIHAQTIGTGQLVFNKEGVVSYEQPSDIKSTNYFDTTTQTNFRIATSGNMNEPHCAVKEGYKRFKRGQKVKMYPMTNYRCNAGRRQNRWVIDSRESVAGEGGSLIKDHATKKWCWNMNPRATKPAPVFIHRCRSGKTKASMNWWQRFSIGEVTAVGQTIQSQVNLNNFDDGSNSFLMFNLDNAINNNKKKRKNKKKNKHDLFALARRYVPYTLSVGSNL